LVFFVVLINQILFQNERPYESIELTPNLVNIRTENEDLPSSFNDKSSN